MAWRLTQYKEQIAVKEAKNNPVVAMVTKHWSDDTDVIIPANDDAIRAVADHSQRDAITRTPCEDAAAAVEAEFVARSSQTHRRNH